MFAWTCSLTSSSICSTSRSFTGPPCEKSKRRWSGATSEPAWVTCVPSTLAQRRVQQVGAGVVLAQPQAARRLHRDRHVLVLAEAALDARFTRCTMSLEPR